MASIRWMAGCCVLTLCLGACEAGRSEVTDADPLVGENSPGGTDTTLVNRGLSGYLTTLWFTQLWKIDLSTGEFSKFPREPFEEDPTFNNLSDFQVVPIGSRPDGFFLGVESCYMDGFGFNGCVQFLDSNAGATKTYYLDYNISVAEGTVPISKDGKMFAIVSRGVGTRFIAIYSSEGVVLASEEIYLPSITDISLAWGVDGVLYYAREDESTPRIYYWDPKDSSTSGHYDFEFEGSIGGIRTSPVDRRIAFELVNTDSSVYMADLSTGKAWRVVKPDETYAGQFFSSPTWSPDGEWLLVQHHNRESVAHGLTPYSVIALPSDAVDLVYNLNDDSPTTVPFKIVDDAEDVLGVTSQTEWFRNGVTYWLSD